MSQKNKKVTQKTKEKNTTTKKAKTSNKSVAKRVVKTAVTIKAKRLVKRKKVSRITNINSMGIFERVLNDLFHPLSKNRIIKHEDLMLLDMSRLNRALCTPLISDMKKFKKDLTLLDMNVIRNLLDLPKLNRLLCTPLIADVKKFKKDLTLLDKKTTKYLVDKSKLERVLLQPAVKDVKKFKKDLTLIKRKDLQLINLAQVIFFIKYMGVLSMFVILIGTGFLMYLSDTKQMVFVKAPASITKTEVDYYVWEVEESTDLEGLVATSPVEVALLNSVSEGVLLADVVQENAANFVLERKPISEELADNSVAVKRRVLGTTDTTEGKCSFTDGDNNTYANKSTFKANQDNKRVCVAGVSSAYTVKVSDTGASSLEYTGDNCFEVLDSVLQVELAVYAEEGNCNLFIN